MLYLTDGLVIRDANGVVVSAWPTRKATYDMFFGYTDRQTKMCSFNELGDVREYIRSIVVKLRQAGNVVIEVGSQ